METEKIAIIILDLKFYMKKKQQLERKIASLIKQLGKHTDKKNIANILQDIDKNLMKQYILQSKRYDRSSNIRMRL